jgi:hypothetical protein
MNITSQISLQAKDFAKLTNNSEKMDFLKNQKEAFLSLNSEEKLAHFKAIQQRTEELKEKIQKPVLI